jgi:hypothetical protein
MWHENIFSKDYFFVDDGDRCRLIVLQRTTDMSRTLEATVRVRVPKPLKKQLKDIAAARSKRCGKNVPISDLSREALVEFTQRHEGHGVKAA